MKKRQKILLCGLLLISIIFSTVSPIFAATQNTKVFNHYKLYDLYKLGICKKGEKPSGDIVIPETFMNDGVKCKIVALGNGAFRDNTEITSVKLPSSIRSIGMGTFYGCTKLKKVTISKKVKLDFIDANAFFGCESLEEININAEKVGSGAFQNCSSLRKINFGDNVKEIGEWSFFNTAVEEITFGKNIESVGNYAVGSCANLQTITIGERVEKLGHSIDNNCAKLSKIIVNSDRISAENCGQIRGYMYCPPFRNQPTKIVIEVPGNELEHYEFLWTYDWDDGAEYKRFIICNENAYMAGICEEGERPSGDIVIPETFVYKDVAYKVIQIGSFGGNKKLTSVKIPSSVTEIDSHAFYGCSKLKAVSIPKKTKLDRIGMFAFCECSSLGEIYINAETVEQYAFYKCKGLKKVTFGENVKVIENESFREIGVKSIDFGKNITSIGYWALWSCPNLEKITVGKNVTTLGQGLVVDCPKLKTIVVKSKKLDAKTCGTYGTPTGMTYLSPFVGDNITYVVPKEKLNEYKKILTGEDETAKYKTM